MATWEGKPTLATVLKGYTPPMESALADPIKQHFANLPQKTLENLAKQRQDIDAALQMTPQGIQIADQGAFNSFMNEVPNVAALTAWHGTPHKIQGAFDINKVGTGEGAQAYGHGMYFAENPAVAGEYARALAEKPKDVINGYINYSAKYGRPKGEGNTSLGYLQSQGYSAEHAPLLDKIIAGAKVNKEGNVDFSSTAIKALSNLDSAMISKGNLYKVDIPDKHIPMMLDYDKPIKDQPEIYELVKSRFTDPDLLKTFENNAASGISGANVYKNYLGGKTDKERSENALALGIKGIRYLDQGSRNPGFSSLTPTQLQSRIESLQESINSKSGNTQVLKEKLKSLQNEMNSYKNMTSNFVVFDPSTVKILEENSKPVSRKEILEQQVKKLKD